MADVEEAHDHAHDEEEAHEDEHDHDAEADHDHDDHDGHDHGEFNAHIWLDPRNASAMTDTMAQELMKLLPAHADLIERNAQAYQAKLAALDAELREQLADLPRRDIVTFHEAFPYFARAYDLHVVAVLALEPEESLTPQMVATLVDTGAKVYELDPVVTGDGSPTAYEDTMRKNAAILVEALSTP